MIFAYRIFSLIILSVSIITSLSVTPAPDVKRFIIKTLYSYSVWLCDLASIYTSFSISNSFFSGCINSEFMCTFIANNTDNNAARRFSLLHEQTIECIKRLNSNIPRRRMMLVVLGFLKMPHSSFFIAAVRSGLWTSHIRHPYSQVLMRGAFQHFAWCDLIPLRMKINIKLTVKRESIVILPSIVLTKGNHDHVFLSVLKSAMFY